MNDFAFSGKEFYEFIDSLSKHQGVSQFKFRGHGVSMTPFIKNGSTLTIRLLDAMDTLRIGDIVIVKEVNKKKIFAHRIVQAKNDQYLIKGDNKTQADGWFSRETILGIITEIKNESGKIMHYSPWSNLIIACLSKTRILDRIMLPSGRILKQKMGIHIKNG